MRLKDRSRYPPGGYRYYTAATNFSIQPWVSFDVAVQQILAHRQANPYQCQKNGWSLDPAVIAAELDAYNTDVCVGMGWTQYITDGTPEALPPKSLSHSSLLPRSAARAVEGIKTIARWEMAGGSVVDDKLANQRARVCSGCPKNDYVDISTYFTEAAAKLVLKQLEHRNQRKLRTDHDPLLGICSACGCVCKLKVHAPLDIILSEMKPEAQAALHPDCWIKHEQAALLDVPEPAA
jgi:hypothetical protein